MKFHDLQQHGWTEESIMLSEMSGGKRPTLYDITNMWTLKIKLDQIANIH